jgi:hypothetical protein
MTKIIVGRLHIAWIKLRTSGHSGIWQGQAVMQGWAKTFTENWVGKQRFFVFILTTA